MCKCMYITIAKKIIKSVQDWPLQYLFTTNNSIITANKNLVYNIGFTTQNHYPFMFLLSTSNQSYYIPQIV